MTAAHLCQAIVVVSICASLGAQEQARDRTSPAQQFAESEARLVQEAQGMLRSDDPCSVAWGAYSVAKYQLAACRADLRARLVLLGKDQSRDQPFAALAILDALIQTNGFVLGEELEPFLNGTCAESAFVLLARRPAANRARLLQLFHALGRGRMWLACGNLLAKAEDPDFVLALLRTPVELEVDVAEPGAPAAVGGSRGVGTRIRPSPPKGYPPIWFYRLGEAGDLVADGTRPVHAERTRTTTDCEPIGASDYQGVREAWLAGMLGREAPAALLGFRQEMQIEWTGVKAFVDAMQQRRRELGRAHRDLVAACVHAKLVTEEAVAGMQLSIRPKLLDRREDRSEPLPAFPTEGK